MFINKKYDYFWTHGNGKDFLDWAQLSREDLESDLDTNWFYKFDKKADKLAHDWLKNGDFKSIMKSLHSEEKKNLPHDYIDFKNDLKTLPDWVNQDLIYQGCKLSERSGLNGLLVLRNFALLGGYYFANLTKPLVATGALEKGAVHRLFYTLNFWIEVSRTGTNSQEKRLNACMQTRLIHSVSRLNILKNQPNWNDEKYGIPINYADMVATNIAFTVYYLYGLQKLNFHYTKEEEEGIFHLWKYVTYLLDVPVELIPNNVHEALTFFYFWSKYQGEPDEDSINLAQVLLNENVQISLLKFDLIKRNMSYIHKSISNYLIDENIRKTLHIPSIRFKNMVPKIVSLKNQIKRNEKEEIKEGKSQQQSILNNYKETIVQLNSSKIPQQ